MPPAALEITFEPVLRWGDLAVRWQTLGVAAALLSGLGLAALLARREEQGLRLGDLAYIVLGIVPGAVAGGRIVHGLAFADGYADDPLRLLDPHTGSLSLLGAVLGGLLTGAWLCRLVGVPLGRWAAVAAAPTLLAIGLGKLAQFLGGSGQGAFSDEAWAVAFVGDGAWVSAQPTLPAHPAQVYEGLWMLVGVPLILLAGASRPAASARGGGGRLLIVALAWFLLGRVVVGFTWRDLPLLGPLNAEQAVALSVLVLLALLGLLLGLALVVRALAIRALASLRPRE